MQLLSVLWNWAPVYIRCSFDQENRSRWAEESVCFCRMPGSCSHTGSHRRTEVFPLCSHIFSPGLPYCLKKIFKPLVSTHPINNSSFALCPRAGLCHLCGQAGRGWSAEQFGKTLQNDPTQLHLLCSVRVFEKFVIICHFEHTQAVVLFEEFWDLLGLRKTTGKKVKMWVPCSAILPRYYFPDTTFRSTSAWNG